MILVTGGAGYIGSHAAAELVARGKKIIVLDNLYSGHRWAVPKGSELVVGSISDRPLVEKVIEQHKVSAVMHFAAHVEVHESTRLPEKYYVNNSLGTMQLLQACLAKGVKHFIFSSSCSVYGTPAKNPVDESTPFNPVSPYGKSKLFSEHILSDFKAAGHPFEYVSLRYFNVAGARADGSLGQATPNATQLVKVACEVAAGKRKKLMVYGSDYPTKDGTCVRDYIHVDDLADLHVDSLDYLERGGSSQVFNCGYGTGYSVKEVVEMVKRVSGVAFAVEFGPRREGDPTAIFADPKKLQSILKWKPKRNSLEVICRSAWEWEKTMAQKNQA